MADQLSRRLLNVLLGGAVRFRTMPAQNYGAGAGFGALVNGATMTVAAGAWPAYADIVSAAAAIIIATEYFIYQVMIDIVTLACTIDLQIYNATTVATVFEAKFACTAVSANLAPINTPYPIYCIPLSQIQGRIGGTAGKTCNVSVLVATGI